MTMERRQVKEGDHVYGNHEREKKKFELTLLMKNEHNNEDNN